MSFLAVIGCYDHKIVIDFNNNSLIGKFQREVQHISFIGEIGSGANVSISEILDNETFEYKTERILYSNEEISEIAMKAEVFSKDDKKIYF